MIVKFIVQIVPVCIFVCNREKITVYNVGWLQKSIGTEAYGSASLISTPIFFFPRLGRNWIQHPLQPIYPIYVQPTQTSQARVHCFSGLTYSFFYFYDSLWYFLCSRVGSLLDSTRSSNVIDAKKRCQVGGLISCPMPTCITVYTVQYTSMHPVVVHNKLRYLLIGIAC
jgi:hypothetical protein